MVEASKIAHNIQAQSVGKAHRMRLAVRLYRMGWQIKEIAAVVGVGTGTISKYIKQAKEFYHQQAVDDVQRWVADCLEALELVEDSANEQWLAEITRDKDNREKTTTSGKGSVTTEKWEEDHKPDAVYLRVLLDVIKQRRGLLALDKMQEQVIRLRGTVAIGETAEVTQAEADAIAEALKEQLGASA